MRPSLIVMLAALVTSASAQDMQRYLSETQALVTKGEHAEALQRYIWFHDHALEHEPAMYGVRLSFALAYWKSLGEVYPPAQQALVEIRDRKAAAIADQQGDTHLFHDVAALNETLGEGEKTVALFEQVHQRQPAVASAYWRMAKKAVIAQKRYDLVKVYLSDPVAEFSKIKWMYDHGTTNYADPRFGGETFKQLNEQNFTKESLTLITVLLAIGDTAGASAIQQRAVTVLDNAALRDAIPPATPAKD